MIPRYQRTKLNVNLKNPEIELFDTKKDTIEENDAKMPENQTYLEIVF